MLVNKIGPTSFKGIYVWGYYNEREEAIKEDIIDKLKQPYPNDLKNRNYADYLKEEENIDIFISKDNQNPDAVKVEGVKKNYDFFNVGEYHSFNFKSDEILNARKKQIKETVSDVLKLAGLSLLCATLILGGKYLQKREISKEIPQKVIQMKDSIANSLKVTKLGEKIIK